MSFHCYPTRNSELQRRNGQQHRTLPPARPRSILPNEGTSKFTHGQAHVHRPETLHAGTLPSWSHEWRTQSKVRKPIGRAVEQLLGNQREFSKAMVASSASQTPIMLVTLQKEATYGLGVLFIQDSVSWSSQCKPQCRQRQVGGAPRRERPTTSEYYEETRGIPPVITEERPAFGGARHQAATQI